MTPTPEKTSPAEPEDQKKKKKKKRKSKAKKGTFLRKGPDIPEFSVKSHFKSIVEGESEIRSVLPIDSEDSRLKWVKKIASSSIRTIWKEFQANRGYKPPSFTTEAYERNEPRNRYNDILCMDSTRVRLKARKENDDYIHANWMTMPDNQKYICTQGPMVESVEDFWHMVFTEKSCVIVMLCGFVEGNHEKCFPYFFAELNLPATFGKLYTVTVKENYDPDPTGTIVHKLLHIEVLGTVAEVHHLAHTDWPDHTAPLSPLPTVALLKLARMLCGGNPITVHCSAGIGRTATFVGIDYAVQKIYQSDKVSMIDVLKDLRNQRLHAIQSPIQYAFLHLCVLEVFIEDGIVIREGSVLKFFKSYSNMLNKYKRSCEQISKGQ